MRRFAYGLAAGVACAALATSWLMAQPVVQSTFTGNECWNAGQGPGGPSTGFICSQGVRGGANNLPVTIAGNFTVGIINTANVTPLNLTGLAYGGRLLVTAQPTAATITLPPSPLQDGIVVAYCNVTGSAFATNVVTFGANTGQTIGGTSNAMTVQPADSCAAIQWNVANSAWYRIN
jgi:hypothetical protein